jgi:hypothetical protein
MPSKKSNTTTSTTITTTSTSAISNSSTKGSSKKVADRKEKTKSRGSSRSRTRSRSPLTGSVTLGAELQKVVGVKSSKHHHQPQTSSSMKEKFMSGGGGGSTLGSLVNRTNACKLAQNEQQQLNESTRVKGESLSHENSIGSNGTDVSNGDLTNTPASSGQVAVTVTQAGNVVDSVPNKSQINSDVKKESKELIKTLPPLPLPEVDEYVDEMEISTENQSPIM